MEITFTRQPIILLLTLIFAAVGYYLIIKSNSPRSLKLIRISYLLICFILSLSPSVIKYKTEEKNTLAIMIDSSDSMFLTKRIDDIKKHLKTNHKVLSDKFNLLFFEFSENFRETDIQKLSSLKPQGMTDIPNSIKNLINAYSDKIDGIILLSDGQQTSGVAGASVGAAMDITAPVFPWNIFENQRIKDISIAALKKPGFAFKGSDVSLIVKIQHSGIRTNSAGIKLSNDSGVIINTANYSITSDGETEIRLSIKPEKIGKNNYTVEISTFPGELTHANNKQNFSIDVMKDKLRILYLCGQPSYEYSFLREFLKNNPTIELVTFVILRNPEDIALVPDEELSLIPFPGADILLKQLSDFDLVIFENFAYQRFGIHATHFESLKKWVENGGGFLMIGGDNSFGKGGYQYTAIKDILPVIMDEPSEPIEQGLFKPQILDYDNPIFSSDNGADFWKNLPELDGAQRLKPHPQGATLIRHPWSKTDRGNLVVLATRIYGKGKTAALGSNSTWRWKMNSENPLVYDTFWKNLLGYLTGTSDESKTDILGLRENVGVGEICEFAIKTQSPATTSSAGRPDTTVRIEITAPDGTKIIPDVTKNGLLLRSSFRATMPGAYAIEILTYDKNKRLISKEKRRVLAANTPVEETRRLDINVDYLKQIAQKSDGIYLAGGIAEIEKIEKKLGRAKAKEIKREIRLNTAATAFFALFVLIGVELILRRRRYGLW